MTAEEEPVQRSQLARAGFAAVAIALPASP